MAQNSNGQKVFNIVRVKEENGEKRYYEVGTALVRENGRNGVLWLNFLDQEFALFLREKKEDAGNPRQG